jgi:tryptophan synthase alpha chain
MNGAPRIRHAFERARTDGHPAFIAYLMAGHPDQERSLAAAEAALAAGADLLEVGVPFSDPLADGPVIAAAGRDAIAAGGGLDSARRLAAALRERGHHQPLLAMSYLNLLIAAGPDPSLHRLAAAGIDGLIVPDLPAGEDPAFERLARDSGLGISFLMAPNTAPARREATIAASSGFVYVVPLLGVTGARDRVAEGARRLLAEVRAVAAGRAPVVAGFGISSEEQVAELAGVADGLVVGSALVSALAAGGPAAVGDLVSRLAGAARRPIGQSL